MADPGRRGRRPGSERHRAPWVMAGTALAALSIGACSDAADPPPTAAEYLVELEAVCAETAAQLAALPDPPDGITVTEFATQASSILTGEAERLRALDAPADLDADHRALIGNDEDQAAGWSDVAAAASGDSAALAEITTTIQSLNLGRNDLVTELGAPGCVRSPG
ncbi:MAG: hypothetical protein ABWZ99_01070 [Ilumatobacteraceae bacterium]